MSPETPEPPFPAIPGYRILRLLGQGGMGRVYLAQDEVLGRTVALKVVTERFLDRPEARQRFLREARSMATVEHPSVVRVYSFAEAEHGAYLVMEYVEGEALSERLRRGRLAVDETLAILREVIDGLDAAWEKTVVHRDVKPGNVLLDRKGHAHVSDFGLAKPVAAAGDPSLTDTGALLGTPFYVSPEQARGLAVDHRSDIYSVGIMAFEMLSGDRPFEGTTSFEVVAKHLHEPLPDLRKRRPDVPEALARTVEWMTAKEPASRPPSYAAVRQALAAPTEATPAAVSSATMTRLGESDSMVATSRPTWRRSLPALAAASVLLGLVVSALWMERRPPPPDAKQLVVAVAPFYGVDAASAAEGRTLAGLVEREVARRLGSEGARVIGVDETRDAVRDHAAARALGERLGANVVVWGDAYTANGQTEVQPSFTLVPRAEGESSGSALRSVMAGRDPTEALREMSAAARAAAPQGASQIELRRTTASGVGDLVLLLAGMHRLYNEGDAERALSLFERVPRSPESLRHRAEALWRLDRRDAAFDVLHEAVKTDPRDAAAHAALGDLLLETDRFLDADKELRVASELGGTYTTRNGIVFEGKLYVRETYIGTASSSSKEPARLDSGYLIAVDAGADRVLERHRLPGVRDLRLSARESVLHLDYKEPRPGTATFSKGRFEKPLFYSNYLLGRRRGVASGRALAINFLDGDVWKPKPEAERADWAPVTLERLEAALRHAIQRDPTQPWLPLLLGQTLSAEGRAEEAEREWTSLFTGRFETTPYWEYCFMARLFEALPQTKWADRAYAEALARRRRMSQPIEAATLLERFFNLPFINAAAAASRSGGDKERAHVWLVRARELSGITLETEGLAAAAWESYFRGRGDSTAAEREHAVVERANRAPGNIEASWASFDLAAQLFLAASGALLLLSVLLASRERMGGISRGLATLRLRDRRVLVGALALCGIAYLAAVGAFLRVRSLLEAPIVGMMDTFGKSEDVYLLERRMTTFDTLAVQNAAAIANHMAGNLTRARELYERMEENPRTRKNWNALQSGARVPPEPMTAEDYLRAWLDRRWVDWPITAWRLGDLIRNLFSGPGAVALSVILAACGLLDLALLFGIAVALGVSKPSAGRGVAGRASFALPGSADLALGRSGRAYVTLLLLAFALTVLGTQLTLRSSVPSIGVLSTAGQAGFKAFPLPFPPGVTASTDEQLDRAIRVFYWDFLRARPEVLWLWIAALVAGVVGIMLHVRALRHWKTQLAAAASPPHGQPVTIDAAETAADTRRSRPA